MRKLWTCVLLIGIAGCAIDPPAESEVSAEVRLGWNWVTKTVAERTCDNPGACATGVQFTCGQQLEVDYVDFSTGMARLPTPTFNYWVLASALSGDPPGCI